MKGMIDIGKNLYIGIFDYNVKFIVDLNCILKVIITIDSLGIRKEEIIKKKLKMDL